MDRELEFKSPINFSFIGFFYQMPIHSYAYNIVQYLYTQNEQKRCIYYDCFYAYQDILPCSMTNYFKSNSHYSQWIPMTKGG